MRPIVRGPHPTDGSGQPKGFRKFRQALPDLREQLGLYCSYCERPISHMPEVEHVRPKSKRRSLLLCWDNLLLSCRNCNAVKRAKTVRLREFYWPDRDNTFRAFAYGRGGLIAVRTGLTALQASRARRTIDLTGLDRPATEKDWRRLERSEAWNKAERALANLRTCDKPQMRETITDLAEATGFFSVWMTVFSSDSDMLCRFRRAFPNTADDCFDPDSKPVRRPGGDL